MNTLLLIGGMILVFSALVLINKFLGESGVIGFMGFATILANIMICKSVDLFGFSATLGNVMFASNFLATDILTECYGVRSARKGVIFAILSAVGFLTATQAMLLFVPNESDFAQESMATLFTLTPRITLASVALFAVSNFADVSLYEYLRKKTGGRFLWLRNNVATILSNGTENFLFYMIAFLGVFGWSDIISMSLTATVIEIIIALCDTPFLYWARGRKKNESIAARTGNKDSRTSGTARSIV